MMASPFQCAQQGACGREVSTFQVGYRPMARDQNNERKGRKKTLDLHPYHFPSSREQSCSKGLNLSTYQNNHVREGRIIKDPNNKKNIQLVKLLLIKEGITQNTNLIISSTYYPNSTNLGANRSCNPSFWHQYHPPTHGWGTEVEVVWEPTDWPPMVWGNVVHSKGTCAVPGWPQWSTHFPIRLHILLEFPRCPEPSDTTASSCSRGHHKFPRRTTGSSTAKSGSKLTK